MSSQSITTIPKSLQLAELPEEDIVRIFGFLDLKTLGGVASVCKLLERLQKDDSIWCSLFPQACSFRLDLPAKERVRYSQISFSCPGGWNSCTFNFFDKTITQVNGYFYNICELVFKHPCVPNGSFATYVSTSYGSHIPSAIIKSKNGVISNTDQFPLIPRNNPFKLEIQEHQGKPSQFHEFKLILPAEIPYRNSEYDNEYTYSCMERLSGFLKGIPKKTT